MTEPLLTVPEAATRLRLSPLTVQRQLRRGVLRGIKRGKFWRVPESALLENSPAPTHPITPQTRAAALLADLNSDNNATRNAAIVALFHADAPTRAIVTEAAARAVAEYDGPDDDFSDLRALDGEPFHFPEEEETP